MEVSMKYYGERKDNAMHGQGIAYYPNGDKYFGRWRNGKKQGQGTMIYANGSIAEGIWDKDIFTGKIKPAGFYKTKKNKQKKSSPDIIKKTIYIPLGLWEKIENKMKNEEMIGDKRISASGIIRKMLEDYLS